MPPAPIALRRSGRNSARTGGGKRAGCSWLWIWRERKGNAKNSSVATFPSHLTPCPPLLAPRYFSHGGYLVTGKAIRGDVAHPRREYQAGAACPLDATPARLPFHRPWPEKQIA